MKIVAISDTHGKHKKLSLPPADCIIHAGDVTAGGSTDQALEFINWFQGLDYQYKIFIAGNHDRFFERTADIDPGSAYYLNDSGVEIEGIKFWGSPIQPVFNNWAFNKKRGQEIKKHWDLIPDDTDVLITHGPPYGYLDIGPAGNHLGCEELLKRVMHVSPGFTFLVIFTKAMVNTKMMKKSNSLIPRCLMGITF